VSVRLRGAATLLLAGLALMMLAAGAAFAASSAAPAPISDFTAAVPGMPGKTWLDLLRQLFPDVVAASASGHCRYRDKDDAAPLDRRRRR
jgi:hypothetical protein